MLAPCPGPHRPLFLHCTMSCLILFIKPSGILTQGTDSDGRPTLRDYAPVPGVDAGGRLDGTARPDQNDCRWRRRAWMDQPT